MTGSPGTRPTPELPPGPRAALVIATASYQDPGLSQLRATADDALGLAGVLGDPGIGGFTVSSVMDADERGVRRAVGVFLSGRGTGDVVLVHLSCHGVLDRRGRLYFAAADTVQDQLGSTGIPAGWLIEQLDECPARQQVVILDCCFSGAFAKGSKGDGELDLERRLAGNARGRAVLTASRSGEYSFTGDALPGAAVSGSVFTAGLVEGLRTGAADADGDGYISVDEAYDFAYRHVLSLGAAQTPQRWLSGGEGTIVLARSPAGVAVTLATLSRELADALESRYPMIRIGAVHELGTWLAGDDPGRALAAEQKLRQIADNDNHTVAAAARTYLTGPSRAATWTSPQSHIAAKGETTAAAPAGNVLEPVRRTPDRAARLLADAERAARSVTDEVHKAAALREVAKAVAATNPDHAARVFADAERAAQSVADEIQKAAALRKVAEAVAAIKPDHAERIARSITSESYRADALREVATAMAATNPDHAERIAQSISNERNDKAWALREVATALAATNPDDAERIAQSITDASFRALALAKVALAVAVTNPDRAGRLFTDAERIAQSITNETYRARALCEVATAMAATNPDDAERIAQSITYKDEKASALGGVARAVAATDPDRAARATQSITDEWYKVWTLCEVATAMAATNPDHAARLLADAERAAKSITDEDGKEQELRDVAKALAATNPDRAERIARSITSEGNKELALRDVAKALAATNPDRAERIARSITESAGALRDVAKALAATNPDRAERIAQSITNETFRAWALHEVARALAATNPDRAERIAQSITNESYKAWALHEVARALAATNPDRAERIAQSITNGTSHKAFALAEVAMATVP